MEPRPRPPSYTLEVFADPSCVKAVVKAILHTIFFHRYFIPVTPSSHDLLSLSLPMVQDNDLETLIDQRATTLVRAVEAIPASGSSSPRVGVVGLAAAPGGGVGGAGAATGAGRAQIGVSFFETKKRKKTYFFSKADEEVCWETWTLDVTCATPRTESGRVIRRRPHQGRRTIPRIMTLTGLQRLSRSGRLWRRVCRRRL